MGLQGAIRGRKFKTTVPDEAVERPRCFPWAELRRRVSEFDVVACPDCGGRLPLVATIAATIPLAAVGRRRILSRFMAA